MYGVLEAVITRKGFIRVTPGRRPWQSRTRLGRYSVNLRIIIIQQWSQPLARSGKIPDQIEEGCIKRHGKSARSRLRDHPDISKRPGRNSGELPRTSGHEDMKT